MIHQCLSTFGCTIQAPNISIHQVFLQRLHHSHLHIGQEASISNQGSTNGK